MADDGRGNFGNHEEHVKAGSMSSGNQNAAQNLSDEDRSKGGRSQGQQNNPGNFANRPKEEVEDAAQKGGSQ